MSITTVNPFKSVRRAGVPVCAIETADPAATVTACRKALNGKDETQAVCVWDIVRGVWGANEKGKDWAAKFVRDDVPIINPSEVLDMAQASAPKDAMLFMSNAHRIIEDASCAQAIWNCRDPFKARHNTLVLLAPAITLPAELKHDAVVFTEPLPGTEALAAIVKSTAEDSGLAPAKAMAEKETPYIVDTLRGLSAFAAEQVLALSLHEKDGIDKEGLWSRKAKMIEQSPGLAVWRGGESFDDLGGLDNLKGYLTRILTSAKTPVRAIGFIDEIEKAMGGNAGDTSGTSQDQLQTVLKVMQDDQIPGMILIGPGGTGKSAIAKASGRVADAPVISIDLGAMKDSLVGGSERRVRMAFEVFKAVSQGKGMFIATCNKITSLPPELRRRFTLGTFFVDLPSAKEQTAIWAVWRKRYGITDADLPQCDGWTGAEIRACCDTANRTGFTLKEAAAYIVPVIKSAPDQVQGLRTMASGRFLSASAPGLYNHNAEAEAITNSGGRRMEFAQTT